jgi:plasmid stability protein
MNLTIENLSERVWERLERKAKVSGRTVEAEAAAILSDTLANDRNAEDMDDLQRMVRDMYRGKLPEGEVDRFLSDRKLEAAAEAAKLGLG